MVHIGIIPDGNRRWFKEHNYDYKNTKFISKIWFEKFLKLLKYLPILENQSNLLELKNLTFYVSSIENLKREDYTNNHIVEFLNLVIDFYYNFEEMIQNCNDITKVNKKSLILYLKRLIKNMNITVIGDLHMLPKNIHTTLKKINSQNDKTKSLNLYLAIAYDFEKDILNYGLQNNENYIREQPNLDIILRTGGEFRISGFFPCHNNYAEIFILDKYWPDIEIEDIDKVIEEFLHNRKRRFGK